MQKNGQKPSSNLSIEEARELKVLLQIDTDGFFYTWELEDAKAGMHHCNTSISWNLLLPLSGQDMNCLEFIYSLISKK